MDAAVAAIAVLAAVAVGVAYAAARRARRDRERLDATGLLADGEVLDLWQDGTVFRVHYRYTPHGAPRPVLRTEMAHCLRVAVPEIGDRVKVRYDPADPRRSRILRKDEEDAAAGKLERSDQALRGLSASDKR